MDRYPAYHLIHLVGLVSVLLSLGAAGMSSFWSEEKRPRLKKALGIVHGIAVLGMLVSGFGLLAQIGVHGMPLWTWVKIAMWLALSAWLGVAYRLSPKNPLAAVFLPVLICVVAMLAGSMKWGGTP